MFPFWTSITEPLLALLKPKVVVEVGSEAGLHLSRLLGSAALARAAVHAIDPKPLFDADDWVRRSGGRLVVHGGTSLAVLPTLEAFDAIFIDGDHNWYTVFHELRAIEQRSGELGLGFPLVLLHDIAPPWGRRDLYYAPETIPAEFRQPYTRQQARPGAAYHGDYCTAVHEGGPRNGVLTAVEDFLAQSAVPLELTKIPGFAGLGILTPRALMESHAELARFIRSLELTPPIFRYIETLEQARLQQARRR